MREWYGIIYIEKVEVKNWENICCILRSKLEFSNFSLNKMYKANDMKGIKEPEVECHRFYLACNGGKANLYLTSPLFVSSWSAVFTLLARFENEI